MTVVRSYRWSGDFVKDRNEIGKGRILDDTCVTRVIRISFRLLTETSKGNKKVILDSKYNIMGKVDRKQR